MREVPVPFPGHSPLEAHPRAGVAAGAGRLRLRGGFAAVWTSLKTASAVFFSPAGLELSPSFGERSVRPGSQPLAGRRRGVLIPCPEGGEGMRLPPSPPTRGWSAPSSACSARINLINLINRPGHHRRPVRPQLRKKGRGTPRFPSPVGRRLAPPAGAALPRAPPPHASPPRGFFPPLHC